MVNECHEAGEEPARIERFQSLAPYQPTPSALRASFKPAFLVVGAHNTNSFGDIYKSLAR